MSASGSTTMWFLAPPRAWTRLPACGAGLVDVPGDRRGADEADRRDVGVVEQRVDGLLVALHHGEDAVRQAGLASTARARNSEADGSFSLGLSTNALPQAMALAHIHSGTIAGKLNGVMPATTPERLPDRVDVDAGRGLLGEAALEQLRHAGGELDVLQAAGDLADGVGEHLAVLGGDDRGELVGVCRAAARGRRTAPRPAWTATRARHSRRGGHGGRRPRRRPRGRGEVDLGGVRPGRRVVHRRGAAGRAGDGGGHRSSARCERSSTQAIRSAPAVTRRPAVRGSPVHDGHAARKVRCY